MYPAYSGCSARLAQLNSLRPRSRGASSDRSRSSREYDAEGSMSENTCIAGAAAQNVWRYSALMMSSYQLAEVSAVP